MALPEGFLDAHYYVDDVYEVARDKVVEFAEAVKNRHPAHYDRAAAESLGYSGLVAPPTFFAIFGALAQRRLLEMGGLDLTRVMQTEQRVEFHRPLVEGEKLSCEVSVESVRAVADAEIIVSKNDVYGADGAPVLTTWTTVAHRAVTGEEPPSSGRGGPDEETLEAIRSL